MRIESLNHAVLALEDTHPAKQFIAAYIDCFNECAGRELGLNGEVPVDQEWRSATDGRNWTFSGFVYTFLAFDIVLDGFLECSPFLTESETLAERQMPLLGSLLQECADAAQQDGNREILLLTDQVMELLSLWKKYLSFRKGMISRAQQK